MSWQEKGDAPGFAQGFVPGFALEFAQGAAADGHARTCAPVTIGTARRATGGSTLHVILDVSRLLLSVHRTSPSGIDRVEMAYARHWLAAPEGAASFVAQSPWGWFAALPRGAVAELVACIGDAWANGEGGASLARARRLAVGLQARLALGGGRGALRHILATRRPAAFLLVSHRSLERLGPIAALRRAGARFVPLIHDLIPLTHPEYSRPRQTRAHAARVATTAALADGIIVNSAATAEVLRPRLGGATPPIAIAPLGVAVGPARPAAPAAAPHFVCLGTIEPRKNHLLLLHLWRSLATGGTPPHLYVIGRRGWENENILDLLERCEALRGLVTELPSPPDRTVAGLLVGARALLYPSFVEGYGLPVAEALALGVPVLCSDLPSLREIGGGVPDYLDPLDGPAWSRAILDYAAPASAARAAQLTRLGPWQAPSWEAHFATVDTLLDGLAAGAAAPLPAPLPEAEPRPPVAAAA